MKLSGNQYTQVPSTFPQLHANETYTFRNNAVRVLTLTLTLTLMLTLAPTVILVRAQ